MQEIKIVKNNKIDYEYQIRISIVKLLDILFYSSSLDSCYCCFLPSMKSTAYGLSLKFFWKCYQALKFPFSLKVFSFLRYCQAVIDMLYVKQVCEPDGNVGPTGIEPATYGSLQLQTYIIRESV